MTREMKDESPHGKSLCTPDSRMNRMQEPPANEICTNSLVVVVEIFTPKCFSITLHLLVCKSQNVQHLHPIPGRKQEPPEMKFVPIP